MMLYRFVVITTVVYEKTLRVLQNVQTPIFIESYGNMSDRIYIYNTWIIIICNVIISEEKTIKYISIIFFIRTKNKNIFNYLFKIIV